MVFGLTVTDSKNASDVSTVRITINPVNHPPVANAGQDQTVNAGYVTTLDGSKSNDPDNDPLTYSWKQVGGPSVTLSGADTAIATFTAPRDITSDTDMTFELTVTDSKNATNVTNVKVTDKYVSPPNQPPTANAGTDQTVNAGNTVTLNGSNSKDPDGNITSYSWTQISGPVVMLNGVTTNTPSFRAPNLSNDTTLKFSLTAKDNKGAASNNPAIVSVIVKAAAAASAQKSSIAMAPANQTKVNVSNEYVFVRKWGSEGSGDGKFHLPWGVAVDSKTGNVYVADWGNNRIQKFDSNGKFLLKWGSSGLRDGEFNGARDIAIDSSGNVYVPDVGRIQKFDSNGNFITKWGSQGDGDGQFQIASNAIAVGQSDYVYVTDTGNSRVQKFDNNGKFITKWGSTGTGNGQFSTMEDIAVDSKTGNVYVADVGNYRIQKFDSNGNFIKLLGSFGTGDGQFNPIPGHAFKVAVDTSGNVYVADLDGHIQIFSPSNASSNTSK